MFFTLPDWLRYEIQERWERLAARKWINKNPRIIISITAASVLILLVIIGLSMPEKTVTTVKEYKKGWFYDPNTGELFVAKGDVVPPIDAPSGTVPSGRLVTVKAYVFSYAYEPNEKNRFIGFLEIPNPATKKEESDSISSGAGGAKQWGQGRLIRRVKDKQWVPADSNEGQAILRELFHPNENGEVAHYCPPE
ncbi:MAG: hypothetical protein WAK60_06000 [Sedimentisphaerales bacterium]